MLVAILVRARYFAIFRGLAPLFSVQYAEEPSTAMHFGKARPDARVVTVPPPTGTFSTAPSEMDPIVDCSTQYTFEPSTAIPQGEFGSPDASVVTAPPGVFGIFATPSAVGK